MIEIYACYAMLVMKCQMFLKSLISNRCGGQSLQDVRTSVAPSTKVQSFNKSKTIIENNFN